MGRANQVAGVLRSLKVICMLWLVGLFVACLPAAESKPQWSPKELAMNDECHYNEVLLDLCQRCAKLTKSVHAYPDCCSEDHSARRWCEEYVYFGTKDFKLRP